jgi:hypothetical protein
VAGARPGPAAAAVRGGLHAAGQHVDPVADLPPGELRRRLAGADPHVELHLLGEAQVGVEDADELRARPGPRLDLEAERPLAARPVAVTVGRPELDLARLEVAGQRGQAQAGVVAQHDPHRAVPGSGHLHDELVARSRERPGVGAWCDRRDLPGQQPGEVARDRRHQLPGVEPRAVDGDAETAPEEWSVSGLRGLRPVVEQRVGDGRREVVVVAADLRAPDRHRFAHVAPRHHAHPDDPARREAHRRPAGAVGLLDGVGVRGLRAAGLVGTHCSTASTRGRVFAGRW